LRTARSGRSNAYFAVIPVCFGEKKRAASRGNRIAYSAPMSSKHIAAVVMALAIGSVAPASAQTPADDSARRAAELAAERDKKAEELAPSKPSLVERALHWYDSNGAKLQWRAFRFAMGGFTGGAGLGYGVAIAEQGMGSPVVDPDQPNRIDGEFLAARTIRGYQRIAAKMHVLNLGGLPVDVSVRWQDDQLMQEDFYGFGPGSTEAGRSNYRLDSSEYGADFTWRPASPFTIGGELSYLTPLIGEGTDTRYPTTQSIYDVEDVPGLSDLPSFVRTGASLAFDWRDSDSHPRRGGYYRVAAAQTSGVNDASHDFRRVDVAAQQIVPLGNRYRRLNLQAAAALTDSSGANDVPFFYQPSLGGLRTLRGFSESRFRDRHAAWARAEYQWEAWWALDAAFFVDAGQVASRLSEFTLHDVEVTYGVGFRMHANERVVAGLDIAVSREGVVPILGFRYGF
jgi:hypothetical protein